MVVVSLKGMNKCVQFSGESVRELGFKVSVKAINGLGGVLQF